MERKELKQILAGVSLAALLAGAAATGCASHGKSSCSGGKSGCGGQKSGTTPQTQTPQGGGMSGCGGASGCGGKKQ
jgi:radical SAM modification target selenobiotic family peptide